jgi:hypothetical protein
MIAFLSQEHSLLLQQHLEMRELQWLITNEELL